MSTNSRSDPGLSRDAFLGGRFHLWQPRTGYRAGIDPILLAAAVPARAGQTVMDLGCGAGAALLALGWRVPDLDLIGVEVQADYAELAARNAAEAGLAARIITADLADLPADLRQIQADHILANPPFFDPARHSAAQDPGRAAGRAETTPLAIWLAVMARRLRPGGMAHVIQAADRLPDLLRDCPETLGSVLVRPVAPRTGRPARLVLWQARKGGRAAFRLLPPLILHDGPRHAGDGDDYRAEISAILRDGAALSTIG